MYSRSPAKLQTIAEYPPESNEPANLPSRVFGLYFYRNGLTLASPFLQSFQGPNQDCEAFIHCCWAAAFIKTKPQVDFHIVCCTMTQQRIEGKYNQLPTPNFLNVYDRRTITMESQRYYLLLVMTARTEHRMPFECRKASLQFPEFLQPCFSGQDDPLPCSMLIYTGDKLH